MTEETTKKEKKTKRNRNIILIIITIIVVLACGGIMNSRNEPPKETGRDMYVCGYDRCQDSGEYGKLTFPTGINVWNNPDPNRGSVHHTETSGNKVSVVEEKRVNSGPGGLWYKLADGGWINDFWLTEEKCTPGNLDRHSFTDCMMGQY